MPFPDFADTLVQKALLLGAADAVPFTLDDIVFDTRTLLKCMFGCEDWGKGLTCPSRKNNVSLAEYKEMLSRYKWGVLVHAHDKHTSQRASYEMELHAFRAGYYFAFSLSDCGLCKTCAGFDSPDATCRFPRKARPALHSVGIDIFATVKKMGLPLYTLKDDGSREEQNWYAAVFVE